MNPVTLQLRVELRERQEGEEPQGLGTPVLGACLRVAAEKAAREMGLQGPIDILHCGPEGD